MKLPPLLRDQLKIPLGVLLPDGKSEKNHIKEYLPKDSYLITVGDRTTEKMIDFDLVPSLQIIDGQERRRKREPLKLGNATELIVENPAAEITPQSITTIKKAFTMRSPVRIFVKGEEDLLVLPVCVYAPDNAVVLYGQPHEGLVLVRITAEIRNKAQGIIDLME